MLKNNKHTNIKLQRAYNKYNKSSFEFSIIEFCEKDILNIKENYYLDLYLKANEYPKNKFFSIKGYNIKTGAERKNVYKLSDKSIEKMIKSKNLSVISINNSTKEIKHFISTGRAALYYNIGRHVVQNCCKNKIKPKIFKSHYFLYSKDYDGFDIPNIPDFKPFNKLAIAKTKKDYYKKKIRATKYNIKNKV
jgi:hypothetical protein